MTEKFVVTATTRALLEGVVKDLSRVRQWIDGFEAAGKQGPTHASCLWRAQQILDTAESLPKTKGGK